MAGTDERGGPDHWEDRTQAGGAAEAAPEGIAPEGTSPALAARDHGAQPGTEAPQRPALGFSPSRMMPGWLAGAGGALAFTTYQANKLFLIGMNPETGRLSFFERTFPRCMGLGVSSSGLWMSSIHTLWQFRNFLDPGQVKDGFDAVYVPIKGHTTGDIDIHDVHMDENDAPIFVATRFNCLARIGPDVSFQPVWMPPFIDRLAAEDRCHLNGLAMRDRKPAFVTCVARSNVSGGWREHRRDGGIVIDVESGEIVASGLSMPHSPRLRDGKLWLMQSGTGEFGYVDLDTGRFESVAFMQGFARGLAFAGEHAIVGVSRPRPEKTFEGLALDERLAKEGVSAKCYLAFVNLATGDVEHTLGIEGYVQELYDVGFVPGIRRPQVIGFRTDEIRYLIRPGRLPEAAGA